MSEYQDRDDRIFVLKTDHSDCIIFVNQNWLNFAVENGVDELKEETLLGRPLWKFISDDSTIHLYQTMLSRVREENLSFSIPFRCDSPDYRRFMQMNIIPSGNGTVSFESRILKLEPRDHVELLETDHAHTGEFIRMCSYCNKVFVAGSGWCDVELAIELLDLFSAEALPQITHTICSACYDEFMKALDLRSPHSESDSS